MIVTVRLASRSFQVVAAAEFGLGLGLGRGEVERDRSSMDERDMS